ncbi:Zinc finger, CCHC-type [Trema orientale]|uniref:Zinc finger, CCHC-type n=1 Tax=Trema orientale TaxID=63057 RepID=A0A2P5D5J0_TREOI|nr:Zinc finger, CCHC-type [Trema orientale]
MTSRNSSTSPTKKATTDDQITNLTQLITQLANSVSTMQTNIDTNYARLSEKLEPTNKSIRKQHVNSHVTHSSSSSSSHSENVQTGILQTPFTQAPLRVVHITNIVDALDGDIETAPPTVQVRQSPRILFVDPHDLTKKIKVEAPDFDDRYDPSAFLDCFVTPLSKAQDNASSSRSLATQFECHNCHAKGHIASRCPKYTLKLKLLDEDDDANDEELVTTVPMEDPGYEYYSPEEAWKRTTIFHTSVPLNGDTYKLVIDGGSTMNVVSRAAIARFNLKPEPRPHPSIKLKLSTRI